MVAYLARYGSQPMDVMLRQPVRRLKIFQENLAELLREENRSPVSRPNWARGKG